MNQSSTFRYHADPRVVVLVGKSDVTNVRLCENARSDAAVGTPKVASAMVQPVARLRDKYCFRKCSLWQTALFNDVIQRRCRLWPTTHPFRRQILCNFTSAAYGARRWPMTARCSQWRDEARSHCESRFSSIRMASGLYKPCNSFVQCKIHSVCILSVCCALRVCSKMLWEPGLQHKYGKGANLGPLSHRSWPGVGGILNPTLGDLD